MEKAQLLLPHPHMPSKATMLLAIIVLHVAALTYLLLILYRAARWADGCLLHAVTQSAL